MRLPSLLSQCLVCSGGGWRMVVVVAVDAGLSVNEKKEKKKHTCQGDVWVCAGMLAAVLHGVWLICQVQYANEAEEKKCIQKGDEWAGWTGPSTEAVTPGACGHGRLVSGAGVVTVMLCKCVHACLLVLGSSLSHHACSCMLTAALYAEAGQAHVIIVSKQRNKIKLIIVVVGWWSLLMSSVVVGWCCQICGWTCSKHCDSWHMIL